MIAALSVACALLVVLGVPVAFALGGGTLAAILGGIASGAFTPTEASVVAVFYALFAGRVINHSLEWQYLSSARCCWGYSATGNAAN